MTLTLPRFVLFSIVLIVGLVRPLYGATFTPYIYQGNLYVSLQGRIEPGDDQRLLDQILKGREKGLPIWGVILQSPGGQVDAGLGLAVLIRRYQLGTFVQAHTSCTSACFFAFAAGVNRWADQTAEVGVHSAAESGRETDYSKAVTINFLRILAVLNVPDAIIGKIVKTPPHEMTKLTPDDLQSMGVRFTFTPETRLTDLADIRSVETLSVAVTAEARRRSRVLNEKGIAAIKDGQSKTAIGSLLEASTNNPFDVEVLGNLGYALYLDGQNDLAQGTLLTALKLQPGRSMTLQNLGLVSAEMGNLEVAAEYLERSVSVAKRPERNLYVLTEWSQDSQSPRGKAAGLAVRRIWNSTNMTNKDNGNQYTR